MKPAKAMTDDELSEAILELAAPRVRMAAPEDLRKITDMLATFAVEAAGRIKERARPEAEGASLNRWWGLATPRRLPVLYGDRASAESDRDFDERVALFEVVEVNAAGAEFIRQIKGGRS